MSSFETVPLEQVRAYWDARPCNLRHSPKIVGTRDYFDEVEARKYHVEPHIPGFADFPRWRGKRVLEIGCGIGTDTINFARAGAEVTAVDLSPRSLDIARSRAQTFGLADRIRFHCGDAENLGAYVPVEAFDLVYAFGVIHHSPRPDRILAQLRLYLAPGGTLKLMIYHRDSWKVATIVFGPGRGRFWRFRELVSRHSEAQPDCPVTYVYGRRQAAQLLAGSGFRISEMRIDHIFSYRIPEYLAYRYVKHWYFEWIPGALFRRLERVAGWHLLVTAHTR